MKTCKIINAQFNWRLQVDGKEIIFHYRESAEYFRALYLGLGYEVIWVEKEI